MPRPPLLQQCSVYGSALTFHRRVRQSELAPVGSLQSLQKATDTTAVWETRNGVHTGNALVRLDTLQREKETEKGGGDKRER